LSDYLSSWTFDRTPLGKRNFLYRVAAVAIYDGVCPADIEARLVTQRLGQHNSRPRLT